MQDERQQPLLEPLLVAGAGGSSHAGSRAGAAGASSAGEIGADDLGSARPPSPAPPTADTADVEQGGSGAAASEAGTSHKSDEEQGLLAQPLASRRQPSGVRTYVGDLLHLLIFYWAVAADALLLKELYSRQLLSLALAATGMTVGHNVVMSMLLIVRQGWLAAASQACGFILTLNPFESLTPVPEGALGLLVLGVGLVAYVLIAASGLIFVAYCVLCYLVTALLFSLLILDLAVLVVTVSPTKAIFKYTDLVYTENFKFSRLVLQSWLQSLPQLGLFGFVLWRNLAAGGPALELNGAILLHALAAHLINVWDKAAWFGFAAGTAGCGPLRHVLNTLGLRGSARVCAPVLEEGLARMRRGNHALQLSAAEEDADADSELAASMVPEYLTPTNGGLLSPGQLVVLLHAAAVRYSSLDIWELTLDVSPHARVGKMIRDASSAFPNLSRLRLSNCFLGGRDAALLAEALLTCRGLSQLQVQGSIIDAAGAAALAQLLEQTPTLSVLELRRCTLRRNAHTSLARALRAARSLRQLDLSGTPLKAPGAAAAVASALRASKGLECVNLAFCCLGQGKGATEALAQVLESSATLRVLAVSLPDAGIEGARRLIAATARAGRPPKVPPSIECHLGLGSVPVVGLERVSFLCVADQDALTLDAWSSVTAAAGCSDASAAGGRLTTVIGRSPAEQGQHSGPGHGATGSSCTSGSDRGSGVANNASGVVQAAENDASGAQLRGSVCCRHAPAGMSTADRADCQESSDAAAAGASTSHALSSISPAVLEATASEESALAAVAAAGMAAPGMAAPSSVPLSPALPLVPLPPPPPSGPALCLVVCQEDVVNVMVQAPLLFDNPSRREQQRQQHQAEGARSNRSCIACRGSDGSNISSNVSSISTGNDAEDEGVLGLDTLDLSGLQVGTDGTKLAASVLAQNPRLRQLVLADSGAGRDGAAALAEALAVNSNLEVLDLSRNEFDDAVAEALCDAARHAAGLSRLLLLHNKLPFSLATLRALMEAERDNPHIQLVLVEDTAAVLARLGDPNGWLARKAADFYERHEEFREARRARAARRAAHAARLQARLEAGVPLKEAAAAAGTGDTDLGAVAKAAVSVPAAATPAPPSTSAAPPAGSGISLSPPTIFLDTGSPRQGVSGSSPCSVPSVGSLRSALSSPRASSADEDTCGVCFDNDNHVAIKYCSHRLCVDCYRKVYQLSSGGTSGASCPFCRAPLEGYAYLDWPLE